MNSSNDKSVTFEDVKRLREITGRGMIDCKKALYETNGDHRAAVEYLKQHEGAISI